MEIEFTEYGYKTNNFWRRLKDIILEYTLTEATLPIDLSDSDLKDLYQEYLTITITTSPKFERGNLFSNILKIMNLDEKIDNLYIARVYEESKSLYPLTKPEKPGKHFIIALIGYYIFGINLLPFEFNINLYRILTGYSDVNNNYPLTDGAWYNPQLIPYMNYSNFCYGKSIITFDITRFLRFDDVVFNNIVLNIIKVRYKYNYRYQRENDEHMETQLVERINKAFFKIKGIRNSHTSFEEVVKERDIKDAQLTLDDVQFMNLFKGNLRNEEQEKALIADNLYIVEQIINKYKTKKEEKRRTGK